jgi:predicted dehydrogenase
MIHDLDLLLALVRAPVQSVEALGVSIFGGHEDVANARLTFANGCTANVTASRASMTPTRRMRIWAPEGYVSLDFAKRSVTLVQPSDEVRRHGLDPRRLTPAQLGSLKSDLFGEYLLPLHLDCHGGDQLTRELQQFVRCVQEGTPPRVSGEDGRDAIALATRILDSLNSHSWQGEAGTLHGPHGLPAPVGVLFHPPARGAAA